MKKFLTLNTESIFVTFLLLEMPPGWIMKKKNMNGFFDDANLIRNFAPVHFCIIMLIQGPYWGDLFARITEGYLFHSLQIKIIIYVD